MAKKMQTKIHIGKELIFFFFLLFVGVFWSVKGINAIIKYNDAIVLENLNEENCRRNHYVVGDVDSYVMKKVINLGSGSYRGVSQSLLIGGVEYLFYTIPLDDGKYIRLMVSNLDTIKKLDGYLSGSVEKIYIEGKIVKSPVDINDIWYSDVEEFSEGNIKDIILSDVIKEVDVNSERNVIYPGVFLVLCSFVRYKTMGGIKNVIKLEKIYK